MFMVLIRGSKEKVIVMFLLRGMKKYLSGVTLERWPISPKQQHKRGRWNGRLMVLLRGRGRNVYDAASRGVEQEGNAISIWYSFFHSLVLFTPATQATNI